MRWFNPHSLEAPQWTLKNMWYNTRECTRTVVRRPSCASWCIAYQISRKAAWSSGKLIRFSSFHLHFEMSLHATSAMLTSHFDGLYAFDSRLLWNWGKQFIGQSNFVLPVRTASLHIMTLIDGFYKLKCMRMLEPSVIGTPIFLLLSLSPTFFYFTPIHTIFEVGTRPVSSVARISSKTPIAILIYSHSNDNFQAP